MKGLFFLIASIIIIGCTNKKDAIRSKTVDRSSVSKLEKIREDAKYENCVFDTSSFKFTSEAIKHYNQNLEFYWDKEKESAFVRLNETDSLILHIGGCTHFTYQAIFITDGSRFNDSEYLIQKTKWLAKTFFSNGFDDKYVYCIENNLYKLEESLGNNDLLAYSIIDHDTTVTYGQKTKNQRPSFGNRHDFDGVSQSLEKSFVAPFCSGRKNNYFK